MSVGLPCGEEVVDECRQLRVRGDVLLGRLRQLSLHVTHTQCRTQRMAEVSIRASACCLALCCVVLWAPVLLTLLCSRCSSSSSGVIADTDTDMLRCSVALFRALAIDWLASDGGAVHLDVM